MKLYAVAYIDFFGNEIKIEFHLAENELDAALKHSKLSLWFEAFTFKDLNELKAECFNLDAMIGVELVPEKV